MVNAGKLVTYATTHHGFDPTEEGHGVGASENENSRCKISSYGTSPAKS